MLNERIDTVVLAAGRSTRFDGNKLFQALGGRLIIARVLDAAAAASRRVILVIGHDPGPLLALLAGARRHGRWTNVDPLYNRWYPLGMFSSIQAGVRQVRTPRFAVVPGDLPGITPEDFAQVLALRSTVARPFLGDRPGHPVVMDRRIVPRILCMPPDADMSRVHARYEVGRLASGNPGVSRDIDTFTDLAELQDLKR